MLLFLLCMFKDLLGHIIKSTLNMGIRNHIIKDMIALISQASKFAIISPTLVLWIECLFPPKIHMMKS